MPAPTDPFGLQRQFEDALTLVETGITAVTDAFAQLVERANSVVRSVAYVSLTGALLLWKRIEEGLNQLSQLIDQLVARCRDVLARSTPIYSLFRAAFSWTQDVQGPVSSKVGIVNRDAKANLVYWKGPAQDAYRRKVPAQAAATTATADNARDVGTWLSDLARLNVDLVLKVVDPLAPIAAKLVEATVDAGTLIGALGAIDSAAEAIGRIVELLWREIKAAIEYGSALAGRMYDAAKIVNSKGGYPDGHWPQAVRVEASA